MNNEEQRTRIRKFLEEQLTKDDMPLPQQQLIFDGLTLLFSFLDDIHAIASKG